MRRTYRSKKDNGGALDHRDVLQNMDEKSSAFDAFYIQNIKQTKRELSCVGSSNAYGVASKKVRKRKYVKRIVKEVENVQPRESMSASTYLTPDKSIRVNKILDPFDQLLNSSSTVQNPAAASNNAIFDRLLPKKESKTYIRKKLPKVKKFNYSSDYSSDSDKENSSNSHPNTTDIRTHELLVEPNNSPQYFDESINKIVNNLSLINNFKRKNSSFNTSYKNRNRFTNNCQSPILQKSPLCSTPFKDKYRGKSIYNFSPISTKERESPNYVTITEENNESNNSIVFPCKEKVPKLSKKQSQLFTSLPMKDDVVENIEQSLIYEDEISFPEIEKLEQNELKSVTTNKHCESDQSLFQIIEENPFLGFSDDKVTESVIDNENYLLKFIEEHNLNDALDTSVNKMKFVEKEAILNDCKINRSYENLLVEESVEENVDSVGETSHEQLLVDNDNFNESDIKIDTGRFLDNASKQDDDFIETEKDTDTSQSVREKSQEQLLVDNYNFNESDIIIDTDKFLENASKQDDDFNETENDKDTSQDNSSFNYVDTSKEIHRSYNSNSTNKSIEDPEISVSKETTTSDSNNSLDSDKESMYDTCESEQSFSNEDKSVKEPKVDIERMNDSVFIKYYEKMLRDQAESSSCDSFNNESQDVDTSESADKTENKSQIEYDEVNEINENNASDDGNSNCSQDYTSSCDSFNNESQDNDDTSESADETENKSQMDFDEINENNASDDGNPNCSQDNTSYSKNTESDIEVQAEIIITDSSTTEEMEYESNNEDERHVSFVTTRRRNEIPNDSMFIFDNSYGSSSTECDKTVLSNKARLSCFDKSDIDLDINVNKSRCSNNFVPCEKLTQDEDETKSHDIIHVNTRKSSRLSEAKLNDIDSSINEETIVGAEDIDETIVDTSFKTEIPELRTSVTTRKSSKAFRNSVVDTFNTENNPELRTSVTTRKSSKAFRNSVLDKSRIETEVKPSIVLQPGKKWERSLSIYRRMTMAEHFDQSILDEDSQKKGRKYRQSVLSTLEMQDSLHNESINSRRSTFISKPSRSTIRFVKDSNSSRISLNTTEVFDDLQGFLTEECDDTVIELSKLSLDSELEVTILDSVHESSARIATARDYVLRRCNQTETILFDECYPETVLKNCHKIGEGVYGEVFLWRGRDGRARVMKIVPIAGSCKVNGEDQKDFHEVISEIVIAMELSALRAPIADIDRYFDEGKDVAALDLHAVENATDVFNEVLAVRCVQGPYPSRLLDLWELYDECKGSENDNPAALPPHQQYMVLELANAGQDLESYQFTGAQQAYALFQQIAFGLAVGEEAFQFEHRDLHWGNVLIAPTEQKLATFVLRGRTYRVPRGGVAATIIDYSLSRISLPLSRDSAAAALYNDLATDEQLFEAVGDYQFQVYRHMRDKLGNDWKNFEPYTNILWLHYTVDKMITALRYKRTTTKIHKHYIEKLKEIKERILDFKSATEYVLTDIDI